MPRAHRARDLAARRHARRAEAEEREALITELDAKLVRYLDAFGIEEVRRRLLLDVLDESGRVHWIGGKPDRAAREAMAETLRAEWAGEGKAP